MPSANKRPPAAIVIAAILAWLAVSGFGNAFLWRVVPPELLSSVSAGGSSAVSIVIALMKLMATEAWSRFSLAYGVTALVAALGIWSLRSWKSAAFLAWSAVVLAEGIWMCTAMPADVSSGKLVVGGMTLTVAIILGAGFWIVRRLPKRQADDEKIP